MKVKHEAMNLGYALLEKIEVMETTIKELEEEISSLLLVIKEYEREKCYD